MAHLTIIRGLPGSGKSHLARNLAGRNTLIIEPDMFCMHDDEYVWTPGKFAIAKLAAKAVTHMAAKCFSDLIYADVLPTKQDVYDVILNYAMAGGTWMGGWEDGREPKIEVYTINITPAESGAKNAHRCRQSDIEKMHAAWEPFPGEITEIPF